VSVDDAELVSDMRAMGTLEGISAAPEGAASLSALRRLIAAGRIQPDETVVLFNTGGALKYLDVLAR
jgi:threonine synthase